jgi:Domain of unknown function (DUF5666)
MNKNIALVIALGCFLMLANSGIILGQDEQKQEDSAAMAADMQWLWGEVSAVDNANKTLAVKYIDYDTDAEKEANILVDEQTVFENGKSLADINPNDTVSIDYVVNSGGKNIAKSISRETLENEAEAPQEEPAVVPEKVGSGPAPAIKETAQEQAAVSATVAPESAK